MKALLNKRLFGVPLVYMVMPPVFFIVLLAQGNLMAGEREKDETL